MSIISKKDDRIETIRTIINGALVEAAKGFKISDDIRKNAWSGHGPDRNSITEDEARSSDAEYKKTKLALAKRLHEIATEIETSDIFYKKEK